MGSTNSKLRKFETPTASATEPTPKFCSKLSAMSFAKPKPMSDKQSKTPMSKVQVPPLTSSTTRPGPSSLQKPTASSVARSANILGQTSARPYATTTKKKSPLQTSLVGCKDPGFEDTVDSRHSCDAWYGKYLQSELASLSVRRNAEVRAIEAMRKDCTMLWAALSAQRTRVTKEWINEDEIFFLRKYAATKSTQRASFESLFEVVLITATQVGMLTKTMEKTQNCLQIDGVTVEDGDLDGISKSLENSRRVIFDLSTTLKDENSLNMAGSLVRLLEDIEQTMKTYVECDALVNKLRNDAVMVASINFSATEASTWTSLPLIAPREIAAPKLVDI